MGVVYVFARREELVLIPMRRQVQSLRSSIVYVAGFSLHESHLGGHRSIGRFTSGSDQYRHVDWWPSQRP